MNVDCKKASLLISQRIDHAAGKEESEALDRHLSECAACRQEALDQEKFAAAVAALPEPKPPAGLGERLRQAVLEAEDAPIQRPAAPVFRIMALAASVVLAVAAVYLAAELNATRAESRRLASALQAALRHTTPSLVQHDAPPVTPTDGAVAEQIQAFRAVRDYLGGDMRWMVTDGDQVELGMTGGPVTRTNGEERETLVLNFEYRDCARGESPRVLSNPEFVLFSGDEVSVRLKGRSPGEPILRYRVSAERLVGGKIRTEVNFANDAVAREDVNGSLVVRTLLTPGKPILIGAGGNGDRRWELFLWGVARPVGYHGSQRESKSL